MVEPTKPHPNAGRKWTPEQRARLRVIRAKQAEKRRGIPRSEETKAKLRAAGKARFTDPAEREKIGAKLLKNSIPNKTPGIYAIRCTIDDRSYVGGSRNITSRWNHHKWSLRGGTHYAALLQTAWDTHGEGAFVFEALEYPVQHDLLKVREQYWIEKLNVPRSEILNTNPSATSLNPSPKHRAALLQAWVVRRAKNQGI